MTTVSGASGNCLAVADPRTNHKKYPDPFVARKPRTELQLCLDAYSYAKERRWLVASETRRPKKMFLLTAEAEHKSTDFRDDTARR